MLSRFSGFLVATALLVVIAGCNSPVSTSQILPAASKSSDVQSQSSAVQLYGEPILRGAHKFTEYKIPSANAGPDRIVTGSDGALWFTEQTNEVSRLGRVTTTGSFSEIRLPFGSEPSHVAWADGSLFVTFDKLAYVDRITPGGHIGTTYVQSSTRGVVGGRRQRVWFTEFEAGMVGIIDVDFGGATTEYFVPTQGAEPYDVTFAGNRDELWFTEYGASKIGRMTGTGKFTEFPTPSQPQGLGFGADGALWFTETTANKIGQMTLTGSVTEYPLPTKNAGPVVITAGPDGALWFTEFTSSKIGRITTSGGIKEIATPDAGADPTGITTGPDHKIWFVENKANAIVRLDR